MNIKKVLMVASVLFILSGVFTIPASAAPSWYKCTVNRVGPAGDDVMITLTEYMNVFTNRDCFLNPEQENRQLAVAMAAMTNGQKVLVYFDNSLPKASRIITTILLLNE
mgnify:CR=1 FL=1